MRAGERVLVTTLTKKMAEDLADYLQEMGIKVHYLHSEIDALERIEILRDLRLGVYDVVVGINLLREGLDLPEVSLVCILDADKEGYLRSEGSLIQTIGRAARHINGHVIMYADRVTGSMQRAIDETYRRRRIQMTYNEAHGIEPASIHKAIKDISGSMRKVAEETATYDAQGGAPSPRTSWRRLIKDLESQMKTASKALEFERAALLRDQIVELRRELQGDGLDVDPRALVERRAAAGGTRGESRPARREGAGGGRRGRRQPVGRAHAAREAVNRSKPQPGRRLPVVRRSRCCLPPAS